MQRLPMHTKNIADENFKKLAELFPQAVTEIVAGHDENNKPIIERAIDKDVLMAEIAAKVVDGNEQRYQFTWPDKAKTVHASNQPIYKTLRPCREESVNFDDTENLYIEGDNLEVLKLLQESYLGKVKMIYIDPPYNTGNDFVYNDRFTMYGDEWDEVSGDYDEEGNRLFKNTDSNGRFHTDWLNMLYPRLKIARDLLSDDGVIFISIDDNEAHNLRKICDEVFGANSFICNFVWEKRTNRENRKAISYRHDNILCYCKFKSHVQIFQLPMTVKALSNYKNPDNDTNGLWKSDPATAQAGHGTKSQFYDLTAPNGKIHKLESGRCWLYTEPVMNKAIEENRIWFGKDGNGVPRIKTYLNAKDRGLTPESIVFAEDVSTNEIAKNKLKELFNGKAVFETPKPLDLILHFLRIGAPSGIILDFFSGSAVTAHAVMQLNAEDGGKRKFIMVQLPEATDEKSEAYKAGYTNICEIGKERIRRAGAKIKDKIEEKNKPFTLDFAKLDSSKLDCNSAPTKVPDIGFRVLKVDSSHFADNIARTPSETTYKTIMESVDNIKHDRSPEDLLFYAMHQLGIPLSSKITPVVIQDKKIFEVYYADMLYLTASFDKNLTESIITDIAQKKPLYFAMRDSSQAKDSVATNFDEIFKLYSPSTERWVL